MEAVMIERPVYPRMWTIRQIAKTGILPEHALRQMVAEGELPVLKIGKKNLINFDKLLRMLEDL